MRIVIPGDPIANMRHRHRLVGKKVWTYDPQMQEKKLTARVISEQLSRSFPKEAAYVVKFQFNFLPPKSASNAKKNLMLWGVIAHTTKPDYDNLCKFYGDIGNELLWPDDRFIVDAHPIKRYAEEASTIIDIEQVEINMTEEQERVFKIFSPEEIHRMGSEMSNSMNALYPAWRNPLEPEETQLVNCANLLVEFANKWADKLKKIKGK